MKYWSGVFTWTSESNVFIVLYGEIKTQNMSYTMALLLPVWPSSQQNALQLSHLRQWAQRCHGSIMPSNQKTGLGLSLPQRSLSHDSISLQSGKVVSGCQKADTECWESEQKHFFIRGGREEGRERERKKDREHLSNGSIFGEISAIMSRLCCTPRRLKLPSPLPWNVPRSGQILSHGVSHKIECLTTNILVR